MVSVEAGISNFARWVISRIFETGSNHYGHSADSIKEGYHSCRSGSAEVKKYFPIIWPMTVNRMLTCLAKGKRSLSFPKTASKCLACWISQLLLNQEAKPL